MPLVSTSDLPAFDRLRAEGQDILPKDRAEHQDIRPLHIGLLNMMPDGALEATERQFLRLVGNAGRIAQFEIHLFTLPELERGQEAQKHINTYYDRFEDLKDHGLDALIITGANVEGSDLTQQDFWKPLCNVIDWAKDNVVSVLCSCLATHAVVRHLYNIERQPLDHKCWGIYDHKKTYKEHPLLQAVNTRFIVPHSRHNAVSRVQLEKSGCYILVDSKDAGIHMATSPDGFQFVLFQGHPEYDTHSLLKEYKREVIRFIAKERSTYPQIPKHYFNPQALDIMTEYKDHVLDAQDNNLAIRDFPEELVTKMLANTWRDTSKSMLNNWLGKVYHLTNVDLKKQYMDGINPDNPLDLIY